jgi:predicted DCC family thiol-disulfide oxidoreductase YuxK
LGGKTERQDSESGRNPGAEPTSMKTIIYFDSGCPVCARGAAHWQRRDWARRTAWVDLIDQPDALAPEGVSFAAAMETLHVRDRSGRLVAGGDAFLELWDQLPGWRILSAIIRRARLSRVFDRAYRWHSRGRFEKRCGEGGCPVPGKGRHR